MFYVSCNKEKLKAPQASFLVVDRTELTTTTATQGSNSHKITDIWLYVNDNFKGVFPIGSLMPIVAKENAEIVLYAGIENNGISATRQPYTFYKSVKFTQSIEAGKTYTYTPNFEYIDEAHSPFRFIEDLENTNGILFSNAVNSYSIITDPGKTYGGIGKSLLMTMTDALPNAEIQSPSIYGIPLGADHVYLELNYKCNQAFTVGVIAGTQARPAISVNAKDEWNKIYILLNQPINTQPVFVSYKIFIAAEKTVENPEIYIDNVKLVTF